jgi:hypothetical protein
MICRKLSGQTGKQNAVCLDCQTAVSRVRQLTVIPLPPCPPLVVGSIADGPGPPVRPAVSATVGAKPAGPAINTPHLQTPPTTTWATKIHILSRSPSWSLNSLFSKPEGFIHLAPVEGWRPSPTLTALPVSRCWLMQQSYPMKPPPRSGWSYSNVASSRSFTN